MLIGVDHGNKQIKTVHGEPFVSGLQQSLTRPFGQSLQYCGTYYTLSNERIPFHKDKTEDDRFFVLTLIAIAEEITARGIGEKEQQHIQLAVGLPPAHFGSQAEKFTAYFQGRGLVEFMYGDKHYTISIEDVACYPQAYAAAATMLHALLDDPKAVVLDIGGFTAPFSRSVLDCSWKKIVNTARMPVLSAQAAGLCSRYRHFIFAETENYYYIGIPGRKLKTEQPEQGRSGFSLWQPVEGAEDIADEKEAYGYWICAINKNNGEIEEI